MSRNIRIMAQPDEDDGYGARLVVGMHTRIDPTSEKIDLATIRGTV